MVNLLELLQYFHFGESGIYGATQLLHIYVHCLQWPDQSCQPKLQVSVVSCMRYSCGTTDNRLSTQLSEMHLPIEALWSTYATHPPWTSLGTSLFIVHWPSDYYLDHGHIIGPQNWYCTHQC